MTPEGLLESARWSALASLEGTLTSAAGFGVELSPLQKAVARGADGRPQGAGFAAFFGPRLVAERPAIVTVIAGVRSGKSFICGAAALRCAFGADLSKLQPRERARVPIVAPTVDNAKQTYDLLVGKIADSPFLASRLVGEPKQGSIIIRRQDDREVEIAVVAAHRGAVTLRSRWLAGFVFDEVAQFGQDSQGYAVNAEELLRGAEPRLLPGGQGWLVSSPWGSQGLLYELWREHWGRPGRHLVVRAPTEAMNPRHGVDPSVIADLRVRDPDTAAREFDAAWTDPEQALLPAAHVDAAAQPEREREPLCHYFAAMDPGTRSNAWTLAIGTRRRVGNRVIDAVVKARQWQGSKTAPLSPDKVLGEIAEQLRPYGCREVVTDQYSADALRDIGERHGLILYDRTITSSVKLELFENLRTLLADQALELVSDPAVRSDLLLVRKRVGLHGVTIDLPRTPDGRHCDYAIAVAMLLGVGMRDPDVPANEPAYRSPEWYRRERDRDFERDVRASRKAGRDRWEGIRR